MSEHHQGGVPPAPAPKNFSGIMIVILAALVVVAMIAWFLFGTFRAPGPAARQSAQTATERSFPGAPETNAPTNTAP